MRRRIAVTGGRDFDDEMTVVRAFKLVELSAFDTLVHGGCRGCDAICGSIAEVRFRAEIEVHEAAWERLGRAAGPTRNREMLRSNIDLLIAFPGGRGTANCVQTARKLGIPILVMGG